MKKLRSDFSKDYFTEKEKLEDSEEIDIDLRKKHFDNMKDLYSSMASIIRTGKTVNAIKRQRKDKKSNSSNSEDRLKTEKLEGILKKGKEQIANSDDLSDPEPVKTVKRVKKMEEKASVEAIHSELQKLNETMGIIAKALIDIAKK